MVNVRFNINTAYNRPFDTIHFYNEHTGKYDEISFDHVEFSFEGDADINYQGELLTATGYECGYVWFSVDNEQTEYIKAEDFENMHELIVKLKKRKMCVDTMIQEHITDNKVGLDEIAEACAI